jgi:hypothetical protein
MIGNLHIPVFECRRGRSERAYRGVEREGVSEREEKELYETVKTGGIEELALKVIDIE